MLRSNDEILAMCAALVPSSLLVKEERELFSGIIVPNSEEVVQVVEAIRGGHDVLGDAFMRVNSSESRRPFGQTYTPCSLVETMVEKARSMRTPSRVVDVGCGSGRYAIACARAFPDAEVIAIDLSPMATLMCKASVCAAGLENRVKVCLEDFTAAHLPSIGEENSTLWIGNPPYVRHHDISSERKSWLEESSSKLGMKASKLSGLHAYFIASIALRLQRNDFGVLVTSAEWLEVNYGSFVRELLVRQMGLVSLSLFDKNDRIFQDADTTAVVFSFDARKAGCSDGFVDVAIEGERRKRMSVSGTELDPHEKWRFSPCRGEGETADRGFVRLGEFARVHRGIATGANKFWVTGIRSDGMEKFTIPVVSHAREIMTGASRVTQEGLSRLVVLPENLDDLPNEDAELVRTFIREGERLGVDRGYIARSRKRWWSISVGEAATILMTYMARRAPVFVANPDKVHSLNVVHGIYPQVQLSDYAISGLVEYLNAHVSKDEGRTYCGGLTKFEPREVESLWVPSPAMLEEGSWRS